MRLIFFLLLAGYALYYFFSNDKWTAFVYPNIEEIPSAGDVQNYTIGEFLSFEECQAAAVDRVNNLYETTGVQGDYECGLNCTLRDEYGGLLICDEDKK